MSIGTKIKNLRRERNITQEQLAEYLGITSRAVSQWECDRTAPDLSQLPILANVFEVTTDFLLSEKTRWFASILFVFTCNPYIFPQSNHKRVTPCIVWLFYFPLRFIVNML